MNEISIEGGRALAHILEEMIDAHEMLLEAVLVHRRALSASDREQMTRAIEFQTQAIERIRVLDSDRQRLFGKATTVRDIAAALPESVGSELLELGKTLRQLVEQIRAEQAVVAQASRSLLGHMEGLFRQVSAKLSHAGTYGRGGCVDTGNQVISGIDLTR